MENKTVELLKARANVSQATVFERKLDSLSLPESVNRVKQKSQSLYHVLEVPLDSAIADLQYMITGDALYFWKVTDSNGNQMQAEIRVKFNRNDSQYYFTLTPGKGAEIRFDRFFLTSPALTGARAEFLISHDIRAFRPVEVKTPYDNLPAERAVSITTNVTTHEKCRGVFCGALDNYDLYVNGSWIAFKQLGAGVVYPIRATGARHNTGSTAPDAGDIVFLY